MRAAAVGAVRTVGLDSRKPELRHHRSPSIRGPDHSWGLRTCLPLPRSYLSSGSLNCLSCFRGRRQTGPSSGKFGGPATPRDAWEAPGVLVGRTQKGCRLPWPAPPWKQCCRVLTSSTVSLLFHDLVKLLTAPVKAFPSNSVGCDSVPKSQWPLGGQLLQGPPPLELGHWEMGVCFWGRLPLPLVQSQGNAPRSSRRRFLSD